MNKVVGIALGAGLVYGIVKLLKMQNVSDISTLKMVNPRIHAINLGGLTLEQKLKSTTLHVILFVLLSQW